MRDVIEAVAAWDSRRLAFHTHRQAADFQLPSPANVVGNGFDLSNYTFQSQTKASQSQAQASQRQIHCANSL